MREIRIPKGERTRVLYIWSSSIPGPIRFSAETLSGAPVAGMLETNIRRWFKFKTTKYPLKAENLLHKGMLDASYQIYVTPDADITLRFQTRHFQAQYLILALGVVLGLGLIAGLMPFIVRSLGG